jgi:hypothetical protein
MTLILLALSLSVALCIIAYNLAIHALPFMVGLSAAQFVYGVGAGVLMSGLVAIGAALLSIGLVIAVLGFAKNPVLRLITFAVFAVPTAIAGSFMESRRTPSTRALRSTCSAALAGSSSVLRP